MAEQDREAEFDGETPDIKRAAEKREAALAASRVEQADDDAKVERDAPPKSRRSKPADEA